MPNVMVDVSDVQKLGKELETVAPREMHRAIASALNRTLTFIGAETKRQVKQEYAVRKSINKSVKKTKATAKNLIAIADYTDKPLPVWIFKYSFEKNKYRSPVTVTIKNDGSKTHTGIDPAMFVGYGKPMTRKPGQRSINTAYTVSIPQMISNPNVYDVIAEKAKAKLYERMEHEVSWRLSRLRGNS